MDKQQRALLVRVQEARVHLEERQDVVEEARDAYIEAVRRLYDSGMPLREIADQLGLSHQRVHQMVSGRPSRLKTTKKVAKVVAGLVVIIVIAAVALQLARADVTDLSHRKTHVAAPSVEEGQYLFAIRGRVVEQHPELETLTSDQVKEVRVIDNERLRVEWTDMCAQFAQWIQVTDNEWMLTGPPSQCEQPASY